MSGREVSFNELAQLMMSLTEEEKLALVARPEQLKEFAADLTSQIARDSFFIPFRDDEVAEEFSDTTAKWRKLAVELRYAGPVIWIVKEGFTLKEHAPKAGPCYKNFQGPNESMYILNDEPTKNSLVFWIPRLVGGSTGKSAEEHITILAELRQRFGLPAHHLTSRGSAALLAGLMLAHFNRTEEMVSGTTCTDSLCPEGRRVCFVIYNNELCCTSFWDSDPIADFGCFPLGVELGA